MNAIENAYDRLCEGAERAEQKYVSLYENRPYYGGPEEGGWWGSDTVLVATKAMPTESAANQLKEEVEKTAKEHSLVAKRSYGDRCRQECDWLDARGLDADYLPEPAGPSDFFVVVESVPGCLAHNGSKHYE